MNRIPGLREIVVRGRQEAGKWIERTPPVNRLAGAGRARAGAPAVLDLGGFFPGPLDADAARLVAARWPEVTDDLVQVSEAAARGRFDLLGYPASTSARRPTGTWSRSPAAAPRTIHWSRIDPLAYDQVGDSKVVWELSRHQWIVSSPWRGALTGDARMPRPR